MGKTDKIESTVNKTLAELEQEIVGERQAAMATQPAYETVEDRSDGIAEHVNQMRLQARDIDGLANEVVQLSAGSQDNITLLDIAQRLKGVSGGIKSRAITMQNLTSAESLRQIAGK